MIEIITDAKSVFERNTSTKGKEFLSNYQWCLNPILTFEELLSRLFEELERTGRYEFDWQRNESRINIYLFACAISCTLTDYLTKRRWYLAPLAKLYPAMRRLIKFVESILNFPDEVKSFLKFRRLWQMKMEWDGIVEHTCKALLMLGGALILPDGSLRAVDIDDANDCIDGVRKVHAAALPADLLNARMKLNEGFICQDLSYQDVATLAERFMALKHDKGSRYLIIGARTAGSYLAPLLKVYLERNGFVDISWTTMRPKFGPSWMEKRQLIGLLKQNANVILIDDYMNTGNTLHMLEEVVRSLGVPPEKITILAPIHPVVVARQAQQKDEHQKKPERFLSSSEETKVVSIYHDDLYIAKLMEPNSAETFLREFLSSDDLEDVSIREDHEVEQINKELWSHYSDSFQVRLKRVYEIEIRRKGSHVETKRVLAKSVGLGWLGYHAYEAGEKLNGFVPKVIGIRNGILFMEWVGGSSFSEDKISGDSLSQMSSYLARRTRVLSLKEDPRSRRPYLGWGWLEILAMLRKVYNNLFGYVKYDYLLRSLKQALHSKPTLVDGRMRPDEWVVRTRENYSGKSDLNDKGDRLVKVDFEQHNFGAPELDIVDPAYDIAIMSFEFQLTEEEEAKVISQYSKESGDEDTLLERIFIYKLLYATAESERIHHSIMERNKRDVLCELNRRSQRCWDFRVFAMNKFCSSLMTKSTHNSKLTGLFFMDIDGVFDVEVLGFPHTTIKGLEAISYLRSNGYSVIPNTGRSCSHVRNYCASYGFDGGIGEYGSVIVDMVHDKEIPLISDEVAEEISRCRKVIDNLEGVFIDPNYLYSVRAFRYTPHGTQGMEEEEVEKIFKEYGFSKLRAIVRDLDTYIVGKEMSKGKAIDQYKKWMDYPDNFVTGVIGDSDEDVSMLESVKYAFAPRNCSESISRMGKQGKCTIVSKPAQLGLMQTAEKISNYVKQPRYGFINQYDLRSLQYMVIQLLRIAEFPRYKRIISLFV